MATDGGTSDATIHSIEQEARKILIKARDEATQLISEHKDALEALADHLVDKESIEGADLLNLMGPSVKVRGVEDADALH